MQPQPQEMCIRDRFSGALSNMERGADRLIGKMQPAKEPEELKQSVKSELYQLKSERSGQAKAPAVKEQAR